MSLLFRYSSVLVVIGIISLSAHSRQQILVQDNPTKLASVTYEGLSYHVIKQHTIAIPELKQYYSTTIDLMYKSPMQDENHNRGKKISIEFRYPLKEGEYSCGDWGKNGQQTRAEILFIEETNDVKKIYSSRSEQTDEMLSGGSIKICDINESSWKLEFSGAGNLILPTKSNEEGRCGTGLIEIQV